MGDKEKQYVSLHLKIWHLMPFAPSDKWLTSDARYVIQRSNAARCMV